MRRFLKEGLVSAGALLLIVIALMAVDGRVRERIDQAMSAASSPQTLADTGERAWNVAGVMFSAARSQSIDHAPLVIFVTAASALVVFMLRL